MGWARVVEMCPDTGITASYLNGVGMGQWQGQGFKDTPARAQDLALLACLCSFNSPTILLHSSPCIVSSPSHGPPLVVTDLAWAYATLESAEAT